MIGLLSSAVLAAMMASQACATSLRPLIVDLEPMNLGRCDGSNRTDCGYYGINQQQCTSKGCCWQPTMTDAPEDTPWCFFQSPTSPSCSTSPQCSGHGSCTDGTCQCSSGYATCGPVGVSDCSSSLNNIQNCGSCNAACPSGPGVLSAACPAGKCELTCNPGYLLCYGSCVQGSNCSAAAPFSETEVSMMTSYFLNNININGQGGVVAGNPNEQMPDYDYHWQRDAAISMNILQDYFTIETGAKQLQAYMGWVGKVQVESDPNGIDIRGEPKFYLPNGNCFDQGWCRPQNDGPALRSKALARYAQSLIAAGNMDTAKQIYAIIQHDLEYVTTVWNQQTCDPWEEVRGEVFFAKFAARKAFLDVAKLATAVGDSASASTYNNMATTIASNIQSVHWNAQEGIIMEVPQTRELDSAVHLGVLYGDNEDGFLTPSSSEVQSSVAVLIKSFQGYADFSINAKDDAAGIPGLLVGRYLNDVYNGGNTSQPGGGNPWILCTASLSEIFYRAANQHTKAGVIALDTLNTPFWHIAVEFSAYSRSQAEYSDDRLLAMIVPGRTVTLATDERLFKTLTNALELAADSFLLRIHHHVASNDVHLPEELNKDTGASQGCLDLTWSYGSVLGALYARSSH